MKSAELEVFLQNGMELTVSFLICFDATPGAKSNTEFKSTAMYLLTSHNKRKLRTRRSLRGVSFLMVARRRPALFHGGGPGNNRTQVDVISDKLLVESRQAPAGMLDLNT